MVYYKGHGCYRSQATMLQGWRGGLVKWVGQLVTIEGGIQGIVCGLWEWCMDWQGMNKGHLEWSMQVVCCLQISIYEWGYLFEIFLHYAWIVQDFIRLGYARLGQVFIRIGQARFGQVRMNQDGLGLNYGRIGQVFIMLGQVRSSLCQDMLGQIGIFAVPGHLAS